MMSPANVRRVSILTIAAGITAVLAMLVVLMGIGSDNWLLGGLGMTIALVGVFFNDAYLPLLQGEIGLAEQAGTQSIAPIGTDHVE